MGARTTYILACFLILMVVVCGCSDTTTGYHAGQLPVRRPSAVASEHALLTTRAPAVPVRLIIPAIQVNAPIEQVGVLATGDLQTPQQHPWTERVGMTPDHVPVSVAVR